jgi:hypothetical protein
MKMVNESLFTLMCAGVIGSLFGLLMAFFGYRLFLLLLPVWGFFFGLALGADTIQWLLPGSGFLTTVTSWVVGFVVGAVFAVLSYLFYLFAVAVIAGSAGYVVTAAVLYALGMSPGFLVWIIAMIVAVVAIFITFKFNLQKWVIIIATAILGTGVTIGTFVLLFNPAANFLANPVKVALQTSWLLMLVAIVMVVAGVVVQYRQNKAFTLDSYNRWEEPA